MTDYYRTSFASRPDCAPDDTEALLAACQRSTDKGHRAAIDTFADALLQQTEYHPGVIDGARATVCALKCYESIRTHRPVAIIPADYGLQPRAAGQQDPA